MTHVPGDSMATRGLSIVDCLSAGKVSPTSAQNHCLLVAPCGLFDRTRRCLLVVSSGHPVVFTDISEHLDSV